MFNTFDLCVSRLSAAERGEIAAGRGPRRFSVTKARACRVVHVFLLRRWHIELSIP